MSELAYLKIGELARATGLTVGTLRYYSDIGLLQPVHRAENNYRYYAQNASEQVQFIKKAQALGFTLEEIKQILDVRNGGEIPCDLVQSLLENKIEQLAIQIKQMTLFKGELEEYRAIWAKKPESNLKQEEVCPLIDSVFLQRRKE